MNKKKRLSLLIFLFSLLTAADQNKCTCKRRVSASKLCTILNEEELVDFRVKSFSKRRLPRAHSSGCICCKNETLGFIGASNTERLLDELEGGGK